MISMMHGRLIILGTSQGLLTSIQIARPPTATVTVQIALRQGTDRSSSPLTLKCL